MGPKMVHLGGCIFLHFFCIFFAFFLVSGIFGKVAFFAQKMQLRPSAEGAGAAGKAFLALGDRLFQV